MVTSMSKGDPEDDIDIGTEVITEEMPADPFAPEELKDDPRSQPRDPKKPKIGKNNVTLHGGITVHYSHGWLLNQ